MAEVLIHANELCKSYRTKKADTSSLLSKIFPAYEMVPVLKSVEMKLMAGECVGLLGPNGAGKSTFIKLLCGLQKPTSGTVTVLGQNPQERGYSFLSQVGVVFGHKSSLWWDLPVSASFESVRVLYGVSDSQYRENLNQLTSILNLTPILNRPVRTLSLGERVKSEIVFNLLHSPKVLFLDEPTIGLDINSKAELRECLNTWIRERKMGVLLTSHDLGDIQECSDRIFLLNEGEIGFQGTIAELNEKFSDRGRTTLEAGLVKHFQKQREGENVH